MQPYNKAVMTDKGVELLNKTQAGQCQIEITRMAIGDGNYLAVEKKEEYLKEQLALKNEKNSYPISNKSVSSDNSIIITAIFSNQDPVTYEALVKEGYCINEIGVFAKERGTTEEILYSIAVAEEIGDYMPAFEGSNQAQIIQSYQITVSNMETAEVVINYTGAAMLASDGQAHIANKDNPHGVTKSQLGLGNVDNTSDANKPVSTATQTALNLKANISSPTLTGTPKAPTATAGTNTTQIATTAFVQTAVSNLVNGAPDTMNTLSELATAIEEHQDVTDALDAAITNKVDKVSGKGLSTNDYTTAEKTKLSGIASGATKITVDSALSSTSTNPVQNKVINSAITNIKSSMLSKLKGRRFIFVGDSYGILSTNWIDRTINQLGLTLNENAFKVSANSRGFIGDTTQSGDMTWLTLLKNASNSIADHDTITDIIILGGTNDYTASSTDILNAINTFCNYCGGEYPNAIVSLGMVSWSSNQSILSNLLRICHNYQEITRWNGVYINGSETCWHYSGWFMDDRHPTSDGMYVISGMVIGYILGKEGLPAHSNGYYNTGITPSGIFAGGSTSLSTTSCNTYQSGNIIGADFAMKVNFSTAVSITCKDSWQEIATLGDGYFVGSEWGNVISSSIQLYSATENIYHNIPCRFRIVGKKLQAMFPWKGASGTSDKVISVSEAKIPQTHLICPALGN